MGICSLLNETRARRSASRHAAGLMRFDPPTPTAWPANPLPPTHDFASTPAPAGAVRPAPAGDVQKGGGPGSIGLASRAGRSSVAGRYARRGGGVVSAKASLHSIPTRKSRPRAESGEGLREGANRAPNRRSIVDWSAGSVAGSSYTNGYVV